MKTSEAYILRKIYGENILMPVRNNDIGDMPIVLNNVATTIWEKASICSNRWELIKEIIMLYNLEDKDSEQNAIIDFVDRLLTVGLLEE